MTRHIRLDDVEGDTPLGVHLHIADSTVEQRCLRRNSTTADAHIEHRVTPYSPKVLGWDVDEYPTLILSRMLDLPAATLHIDGL